MIDVAQAWPESLGLVERVAALHRIRPVLRRTGPRARVGREAAAEVRVAPGEVLIEEGAVEAHLFALVEGRVRVHHGDRTLRRAGTGRDGRRARRARAAPRSASVTVLEPALLLRVDKAVLDDLLADWPELTEGVIAALVARLRATTEFAGQAT